MLGENIKSNENIKPNSRDIEILKTNFPQFFDKDGDFLLDRFKNMLRQSDITLNKEGYELKFLGKSYARYLSSTKTETFITPHVEENSKEENKDSENLYIIGDNLDALKHLLGSYTGKIKCIYIDPPYNTGSDGFVYSDNFSFDAKKLADTIGIEEEEAERIINLKGKSSHSAWLTFMYPRLILARELLSDDGVIFISIDNNEQANLKLMCDEVFGEENFIENLIWQKNFAPKNDNKYISTSTEHIMLYSKQKGLFKRGLLVRQEKHNRGYSNPDNDIRGDWTSGSMLATTFSESAVFEIVAPNGKKHLPASGRCWRFSKDRINELYKDNRIWFGKNGNGVPRIKRFLSEMPDGIVPQNLMLYNEVGSNQDGNNEITDIFGTQIFPFPKNTRLIERFLLIANTNENSIILDFFSGSATTAHAVMKLNAEDKMNGLEGNRKYILVQIPELIKEDKPAYKAGYRTIDEIGRERIRRAAKKVREEIGADIDYGFKTYSLEKLEDEILTNLDYFDDNPKLVLDDMVGIFETDKAKGKDAILSTYLSLDGYGLSANAEEYKLDNFVCDKIRSSIYIIEQGLESTDVMELIKRIESLELDITRVIVYVNSIHFNVLQELKKNLSNLKNNKHVELIERY